MQQQTPFIQTAGILQQQEEGSLVQQDQQQQQQGDFQALQQQTPFIQTAGILQQQQVQQQYGDFRRQDDQQQQTPTQQQQLLIFPSQQCGNPRVLQQQEQQNDSLNFDLCNRTLKEKIILLAIQEKVNHILEDEKDEHYITLMFKDVVIENKTRLVLNIKSTSIDNRKNMITLESVKTQQVYNKLYNKLNALNAKLCSQTYTTKFMMMEIVNLIDKVVYLRKYGLLITIVVKFLKDKNGFFVYNTSIRNEIQQRGKEQEIYNVLCRIKYMNDEHPVDSSQAQ